MSPEEIAAKRAAMLKLTESMGGIMGIPREDSPAPLTTDYFGAGSGSGIAAPAAPEGSFPYIPPNRVDIEGNVLPPIPSISPETPLDKSQAINDRYASVPNQDPMAKINRIANQQAGKAPETPPEASQSPADELDYYMDAMRSRNEGGGNPYQEQLSKVAKPQTKGQFLMELGAGMMGAPTFFEGVSAGMKAAMESGDKGKALYYDALGSLSNSWEKGEDRKAEVDYRNKTLGIERYKAMNPTKTGSNPYLTASLRNDAAMRKAAMDNVNEQLKQSGTVVEPNTRHLLYRRELKEIKKSGLFNMGQPGLGIGSDTYQVDHLVDPEEDQ